MYLHTFGFLDLMDIPEILNMKIENTDPLQKIASYVLLNLMLFESFNFKI